MRPSTCALTSWFFKGKAKGARLGFSGESRSAFQALRELALRLPGAGHQRKTSFSPSDHGCSLRPLCVPPHCIPHRFTGRRSPWNWHGRRKFQIKYRYCLQNRSINWKKRIKEPGMVQFYLQEMFLGWSHI